MSLPLLMITNLDNMSEKEQKEFMKNISEGMNENIFFDPNKNNLVKFKKSFINNSQQNYCCNCKPCCNNINSPGNYCCRVTFALDID